MRLPVPPRVFFAEWLMFIESRRRLFMTADTDRGVSATEGTAFPCVDSNVHPVPRRSRIFDVNR